MTAVHYLVQICVLEHGSKSQITLFMKRIPSLCTLYVLMEWPSQNKSDNLLYETVDITSVLRRWSCIIENLTIVKYCEYHLFIIFRLFECFIFTGAIYN